MWERKDENMKNFIELTIDDGKILVNINLISQIVPVPWGDGTRLISPNAVTDVKETYDQIKKMISDMISSTIS